jgi:glycosyltransferase involved in cell wall biosynthesis
MAATRFVYPLADGVVCVSDEVAADLRRVTRSRRIRVEVVGNPGLGEWELEMSKEAPNHAWFEPGQPPIVLGAGHLIRPKGFDSLIRAFSLVAASHDSRLVILGEGNQRAQLEQLAYEQGMRDRVWMPGQVENPYKFMARARVFVLPSVTEGWGLALAEALALGAPVVAFDCGAGVRELLGGGRYGRLIPPGDVSGLARGIVRALSSRTDPVPSSHLACYNPEKVALKYLSLVATKSPARLGASK